MDNYTILWYSSQGVGCPQIITEEEGPRITRMYKPPLGGDVQ